LVPIFFISICFIGINLGIWNLFSISSSNFFRVSNLIYIFLLLFILFEIIYKIENFFFQFHPYFFICQF
jgi:hypothetical protein